MSQLLIRLSARLSSRNNNVCIHKCFRLFSTGPYLTLGTRVQEVLPSGCKIGDVLLFYPAKEQILTLHDKTIPKELKDEEMIGTSHGWSFFYDRHDRIVRISDIFSPFASKSNPTVIPLPRLTDLPSEQIEQVCNVAMSSSSPLGDEDCVVAIKFSGDQLSLCRPGRDLEWTNILTPFHCCENSNVMYSKRYKRFYLSAPGGIHFFSYHLNENTEHHKLVYRDHPELDQSEWKTLSMCSRREYLVESSSSDERYLVKWYAHGSYSSVLNGIEYKTKRFMVFSEEETAEGKFMCYTEDIGEMCIFIASNEAFCIPASSCPGLKPSTIYFMVGHGFGSYDLTTGDTHHYKAPDGFISTPCWLPPVSI
ncbi:hypothetical protein F2Q69_00058233 [Brassica cretica]|uniref:KIB1-4 beta-propeller domain-containing protein n=2 Tax=Brassica TaxID=3705 RepID=A0A0D3DJ05_BRAOL|nr:PREDICTED: uncharacterized protein LOC106311214 [Brassica oleracea var. oleracea]KAF3572295.1 hypothetical protein F2Q69_00058233 [Brassica cretica]